MSLYITDKIVRLKAYPATTIMEACIEVCRFSNCFGCSCVLSFNDVEIDVDKNDKPEDLCKKYWKLIQLREAKEE